MARLFDGSDDRIVVGNDANIQFLDAFTIAAWVKKGATYGGGNLGRVMDKQNGGSGQTAEWLWFNDPSDPAPPVNAFAFAVQRWSGGEAYWYYPIPTPTTDWHHHIIGYDYADGTSGVPLCRIDGSNQTMSNQTPATGTKNAASGTAASLCIGGRTFNALRGFDGNIAETAIWNRKLSAAEMQVVYRYGPLAVSNGLVHYMPLLGIASPEPNYGKSRLTGTITGAVLAAHPPTSPGFGRARGLFVPGRIITFQTLSPTGVASVGAWEDELGGTALATSTADDDDDTYAISPEPPAGEAASVELGGGVMPDAGTWTSIIRASREAP
jgi:hypothetical protein